MASATTADLDRALVATGAGGAKRRILVVGPWLPYPPHRWGAAMRSYQILRHLASHHEVALVAYGGLAERVGADALKEFLTAVRVVEPPSQKGGKRRAQVASLLSPRSFEAASLRSAAMERAIAAETERFRPDIIFVEFSQMATVRLPAGPVVVVDEHNVEFELHRRLARVEAGPARKAFNWIEYAKLRREEPRTWRRAAGCLVTSDRERRIVARLAPRTRVEVVPNGVDLDYFAALDGQEVLPDAIVFTGRMNYRPNADAALFFAREILPLVLARRPGAVFTVVGQDPPPEVMDLAGPHVVVTGAVDDVRPYVARAAAVVAPVRAGSGTRLKIIEALAMGKGLVSTTLGCEGLDLEAGNHLLVADDPAAFAEQVVSVLADQVLAARLGADGRSRVHRRYGWGTALAPLDDLLADLAGRPANGAAGRAG
jgi:polysaccharide biosynthesis protein PslH